MRSYIVAGLAASAAAVVLLLAATVYAAGQGDYGSAKSWPEYASNGCAVGNSPPPGANCTGRG